MKLSANQLEKINEDFDRNSVKILYDDFVVTYNFISLEYIEDLYYEAEDYGIIGFAQKYIFIEFALEHKDLFSNPPEWLNFALNYDADLHTKINYIQECLSLEESNIIPQEVSKKIEDFEIDEII